MLSYSQEKIDLSDLPQEMETAFEKFVGTGQVLHAWLDEDTAFVVVMADNVCTFLRGFYVGNVVHVSIDQIVSTI